MQHVEFVSVGCLLSMQRYMNSVACSFLGERLLACC